MAIDVRQAQQTQQQQGAPERPSTPPHRRGTFALVALALVVLVATFAAVAVFTFAEEPAPAPEISVPSYVDGAFTSEREGGPYLVVPETSGVGFTDTAVRIREGGPYATVEFTDTDVQAREG